VSNSVEIDGKVLRWLRGELMWSQQDLVDHAQDYARNQANDRQFALHRRMVSRYETGARISPHTLRYLVIVLEPSMDELTRLLCGRTPPRALAALTRDARKEQRTNRRDVLRAGTAGALVPLDVLECVTSILDHEQVDPKQLGGLESYTRALGRAYETAAPGKLIVVAKEHADRLTRLLDRPQSPEVRHRLEATAGNNLALMGWLAFDLNSRTEALAYWTLAERGARQGGHRALHARVLAARSILHATTADGGRTGDPDAGIRLLEQARAEASGRASALTQCWMALRLAEEYAARGNPDACRRMLDHAEQAFATVSGQDPDGYFATFINRWDHTTLECFRGVCHVLLKEPAEAEAVLRPALAEQTNYGRQVVVSADLGAAYVLAGQPEPACDVLSDAVTVCRTIGFPIGVQRILGVRAAMPEPWTDLSCVRELDEQLRLVLAG
jgi:hypothetical protein